MVPALEQLNEHINQLVLWFRDNKGVKLTQEQKTRLGNIIKHIEESEKECSILDKISVPVPNPTPRIIPPKSPPEKSTYQPKPANKNRNPQQKYVPILCVDCGVKLNPKNLERHKKKCVNGSVKKSGIEALVKPPTFIVDIAEKWKALNSWRDKKSPKNKRVVIQLKNKSKTSSSTPSASFTDTPTLPHHQNTEQLLDGSRDSWKIREGGRFGSHPSFDNHGEESFS